MVDQSQLFSSGVEAASSVTSSDALQKSWNVITSPHAGIVSNIGVGLSWKVYKEEDTDVAIIAFDATLPDFSNLQADLISSAELRLNNCLHFEFLCTKKKPFFSLNRTAASLLFQNQKRLDQLKSEINNFPLLIITGRALGGSIASLFTLSLLDTIDSKKKRPLCITFGSPLIGDKGFQEAISRSSTWNSCFLHVVSYKDPFPNDIAPSSYTPFGTFLLCSDSYSAFFEDPESILVLLKASAHDQNQASQSLDYGEIVECLYQRAICKDFTAHNEGINLSNSLHASISLQLRPLGWTPSQMQQLQQQQNIDINTLVTKMTTKRKTIDQSWRLNKVKIDMAQLEWYKKNGNIRNIGYYDCYKNMQITSDYDVVKFHKNLTNYWKDMVEEVEMKPQKEGVAFRIRWLYAGTNYRRMVEPLDIAQYYANGGEDYVAKARSKHYKQLEDWLLEGTATTTGSNKATKDNVMSILTIDSCFWAHVEEALLSCKQLRSVKSSVAEKEEAASKLLQFENYVYGQLMNYAVSPEIFLGKSSYMKWWNEYKAIKGTYYSSALAHFMSNGYNYNVEYVRGTYNFE